MSLLLFLTLMFDLLLVCYLRPNCPLELVIHTYSVTQKKSQENSHDHIASSYMSSKRLDLPYFIVFLKWLKVYSPSSPVLVNTPSLSLPSPLSVWGLALMTYHVYGNRLVSSYSNAREELITLNFSSELLKWYKISTPQKIPRDRFPGSVQDTAIDVELVL